MPEAKAPIVDWPQTKKDRAAVDRILDLAAKVLLHGAKNRDTELIDLGTDFFRSTHELGKLLSVFAQFPKASMEQIGIELGKREGGEKLTRNGVYFRIEFLGLTRKQLCVDESLGYEPRMIDLFSRSKVLQPMVEEIKRIYDEQLTALKTMNPKRRKTAKAT